MNGDDRYVKERDVTHSPTFTVGLSVSYPLSILSMTLLTFTYTNVMKNSHAVNY